MISYTERMARGTGTQADCLSGEAGTNADSILYGSLAAAPRRKSSSAVAGLNLGRVQRACLMLFNEAEEIGGPDCPAGEIGSMAIRNRIEAKGFGTRQVNQALNSLERHELIKSVRYPDHYTFTFALTETGKEALAVLNQS